MRDQYNLKIHSIGMSVSGQAITHKRKPSEHESNDSHSHQHGVKRIASGGRPTAYRAVETISLLSPDRERAYPAASQHRSNDALTDQTIWSPREITGLPYNSASDGQWQNPWTKHWTQQFDPRMKSGDHVSSLQRPQSLSCNWFPHTSAPGRPVHAPLHKPGSIAPNIVNGNEWEGRDLQEIKKDDDGRFSNNTQVHEQPLTAQMSGRSKPGLTPPEKISWPPHQRSSTQTQTQPAKPPVTEPELNQEQQDLVNLILQGRNVFYTGSAGVGKSTVLRAFVKKLKDRGKKVHIVAPTGRAALDINGSTTWTYAGWTPNSMKRPLKDLENAAHGKFVWKRLNGTSVLVIDEISMVENLHFERLNAIMKASRSSNKAFGGVQLVVTGDFCQLPPVKPFAHCIHCGEDLTSEQGGNVYRCRKHGTFLDEDKWAFRSAAWRECNFAHVELRHIHRQSDEVFIKILQKCRVGRPFGKADESLLLDHESRTNHAVRLFSTREEVKRINDAEFNRLKTQKRCFACYDIFRWNETHRHLESKRNRNPQDGSLNALQDHRFDSRVELKQGMVVVLLANLDMEAGLVNGSQGVIIRFEDHTKDDEPKPRADVKRDKIDSTANVLNGDYGPLKAESVKAFIERAAVRKWPVVRFNNGQTRKIVAECTVNELGDDRPFSLLSRTQIPLTAAWAMTVHKSQGMSLDQVVVDLTKSFEEGQTYVALSRARSLAGLKVEGLGNWRGDGNKQVGEFLREHFGYE